jgi:hypothetical protein
VKNYIVIDQRNGNYAVGGRSKVDGVDYALHFGGFTLAKASRIAQEMNAAGHEPEAEAQDPIHGVSPGRSGPLRTMDNPASRG